MFFRACFFLSVTALTQPSFSQIRQVGSTEFEKSEDGYDYIDPVGKYGIILHGESEINGENHWLITPLDTELKTKSTIDISLPGKMYLKEHEVSSDNRYVYFMFRDRKGAVQFTTYDAEKMTVEHVSSSYPGNMETLEMIVIGNSLYLLGTAKSNGLLYQVNPKTGVWKQINLKPMSRKYEVYMFDVGASSELIVSVLSRVKKVFDHRVTILDQEGNKIVSDLLLDLGAPKFALKSGCTKSGSEEYIFAGTYSNEFNLYASGIFVSKYKGTNKVFSECYSFTDLNNFFNYLPQRKQERIENAKERKEKKGKELDIDIRIAVHNIVTLGNEYVFIGEAYFPTYRRERTITYVNGKPQTTYQNVFDGYQYTHAAVIGMDKNGKKLWDHCFEMNIAYKPYFPIRFIRSSVSNDELRLIYSTGSYINAATFNNGKMNNQSYSLNEESNTEKVKWSSLGTTQAWYDNYFITKVTQRVKSEEASTGNKKRTRIYLNKIEVR